MALAKEVKYSIAHWIIFILIAIGVSAYLLNYTAQIESQLDDITDKQMQMLNILEGMSDEG